MTHFVTPGRCRNLEEFRDLCRSVAPDIGAADLVPGARGSLGAPLTLFGRRLENRFAIHPMEGWDGTTKGAPSDLTLRRWRRFGTSGASLLFGGEAYAVQADGRANPRQLFLNPDDEPERGLAALLAAYHEGRDASGHAGEPVVVGLQLTHSGRFSHPTSQGRAPRLATHHPILDPRVGTGPDTPLLTDGELESIAANYVRAARVAAAAGFDFVDVKCCHGYLLHELLAARERDGVYGGNFENRIRLPLRIIRAIRSEVPAIGIAVRLSAADVIPYEKDPESGKGRPVAWDANRPYTYGFGVDAADPTRPDLEEPHRFLGTLAQEGVRLVNVTAGSPYWCPHLQRPAAYPPSDGYLPPFDPLLAVAFHLGLAREIKARHPALSVVGTGYTYLQEWLPNVGEHVLARGEADFIGLGRMVLSYPELPSEVLEGRPLDRKKFCRTFSDCTSGPRNGFPSGCYPLDELYRERPEAELLRERRMRQ